MSKETLAGRMRATADVAEMAKHYDLETTLRGWADEVDELERLAWGVAVHDALLDKPISDFVAPGQATMRDLLWALEHETGTT